MSKNDLVLDNLEGTEIAVVGMACRLPGADNVEQFWENLRNGVESIRFYTDEELRAAGVSESLLKNPNYVKAGAPLDEMEMFDAGFFGFGPRDAAIMDPQHRHFLECAWEALEYAGYDPKRFDGAIGVFGGSGHNAYLPYNLLTNPDLVNTVGFFLLRHTGNDKDFLTTRVSYLFDLKGPSVNVQTACSTSLVAIHLACQSLLNGECDMALAGGVTIELPHRQGYLYHEGEILSPDGHCRAFDADSEGTVFGSGVGVVVLKRLADAIEDGDTIHAVILASAVNNDGSGKVNYLAPSVDGQAAAIAEAISMANVSADTITYVETHGTGTRIGDPIEITALTQAFRASTNKKQFCAIGSVKTNIGHLDTAAGVAGFIKVVESLKHKEIPPSLNFRRPNPMIDFENSPFFVNDRLRPWQTNGFPRRAGVSSLGVGGTNAHIVLEEAPDLDSSDEPARAWQLLVLSARTKNALDAATGRLADYLRRHPDVNLADVAYTLQMGRRPFEQRRVLAARSVAEAVSLLESGDRKRVLSGSPGEAHPSVVFMFPGGGAQYPNMGRELYEQEPVYREAIDRCLTAVSRYLDVDLRALMFPPAGEEEAAAVALQRPSCALPALFMTEYAQAQLWMSWGIEPVAMTGHSMGEYTAACLAGVMSVEDALYIVTLRGQLFETLPDGSMLSVSLSEDELRPFLLPELSIAVINSPNLCVISGNNEAIEQMARLLDEKEVEYRRIKIDVAAHSAMLDPILDEFGRRLAQIQFHPPQRPYISNVTGTWVRPEDATSPTYWVRHLRHTVRFADGLGELLKEADRVFLEVGPGQTLSSLVRMHPAANRTHTAVSSMRHPREETSDLQHCLTTLGRLWLAGVEIDWSRLYTNEYRRRIPLPTYPFEHQRYWIEPGQQLITAGQASPKRLSKQSDLNDWFYQPVWQPAPLPETAEPDPAVWLIFADSLGVGNRLADQLQQQGHDVTLVHVGEQFAQTAPNSYTVNPRAGVDYETLVRELGFLGRLPQRVVHLWTLDHRQRNEQPMRAYYRTQDLGFYSLFFLAQALGAEDVPFHLTVITNGSQRVANEALPYPEKATLLGPCRVIPAEFPQVTCRLVDVALPEFGRFRRRLSGQVLATLKEQVYAELMAEGENGVIAWRENGRFRQTYEPAPIPPVSALPKRLRAQGVYLITGGLGGIGLVMADYLARTVQARLVLVSRSGLPPRPEWDNWLETHSPQDKTSRRILKVRELEAAGAKVMVLAADVTNRKQMTTAVSQARQQFGQIHGLIHAAGTLDDNLIPLKTPADIERVLSPKIRGMLLLDELLADAPPDFMVLFSSTSTVLGAAGQVDYVAANAFLNAFAESKRAVGTPWTVAVNWGVWQQVGMAVETARQLGLADDETPAGSDVPHPLLDKCILETPNKIVYATELRVDTHWLLDEHRIKGSEALIPGTGYLELAKAALDRGVFAGPVVIEDLFFLSPLPVRRRETKQMRVTLAKQGAGYEFEVTSKTAVSGETRWQEHVRGRVTKATAVSRQPQNITHIRTRCQQKHITFAPLDQETRQEAYLDFGPRWKNLRDIWFGTDEALARLQLADEFASDVTSFHLHPALMDLATSFALPLLEGYDTSEAFYVPLSYGRVMVLDVVPAMIYSHARLRRAESGDDVVVFDVTIMDEAGMPVVEISRFMLKRVEPEAMRESLRQLTAVSTAAAADNDDEFSLLRLALTDGIAPEEGVAALARILGQETPPQIIVSSLNLDALRAEMSRAAGDDDSGGMKLSRPQLQSDYEPPRDDLEKSLVAIWEDLLGVDEIGIHDDFFELGGHSLIAVRLFARIKKKYAVDFSLATLFEAPTIAECAALLRAELGETAVAAAADAPTEQPVRPATASRREWSALVPIQPKGSRPPFFCVHGGFGNVMNFYDLTRYLGADQPFFGLQARGVDGKQRPFRTLEEMAVHYIEAIRQVQPHGPYHLGGFSMGGEVAYEMARQLQAAGEEVALVVLFDTLDPGRARQARAFAAMPEQIARQERPLNGNGRIYHSEQKPHHNGTNHTYKQNGHRQNGRFHRLIRRSPLDNLKAARRWTRSQWRKWSKRARTQWLMWRCNTYIRRGQTLPQSLISPYLWESHTRLLLNYRPGPYNGRVLLFRSSETLQTGKSPTGMRWEDLVGTGLETCVIEGTHNLVREPYVGEVARLLQEALTTSKQIVTP
ncbi:MAG: SDR family NAD(P)-dependent oxidoreductase [Chloroflexi bacterium]|nr:MAG: SDR family NAD(P)-dependent oxidoreductase [Chloroflexota bacterium]